MKNSSHFLEAALDFSKSMVNARKRDNHNIIIKDDKHDLEIIQQTVLLIEIDSLIKNIKKAIREKQNNGLTQSSI